MIIRVRVIPNAKENDIVGRIGSTVRLKVAAPAIDGKANRELCQFLAEFFEVRPRMVKIVRGEKEGKRRSRSRKGGGRASRSDGGDPLSRRAMIRDSVRAFRWDKSSGRGGF